MDSLVISYPIYLEFFQEAAYPTEDRKGKGKYAPFLWR